MKIKKIIYMYLFSISLNLLGSEIVDSIEDKDLKEAIEASLNDYNAKVVNEQNLEYKNLEKKNQLETVKNTVSEKALVIFTLFDKQIQKAKTDFNREEYDAIHEKIKKIMNIIPHEVLELEKINELRSFTNRWATIQREGSRIIDPLEKINIEYLENKINKIKKTEEEIKIYNNADKYINENHPNEYKIIDDKEEEKKKEQTKKQIEKIRNQLLNEIKETNKIKENEKILRKISDYEEKKRIERAHDPNVIAIQKMREKMYAKVSDFFNKKTSKQH